MEKILKWLEPAYKIVTALGIVGIFILNLWLHSKFVSRDDFEKHQARTTAVEIAIIKMEAKAQTDFRQDETLKDHETRIRSVEHRHN